jgi:hypothetical protein
MALTDARGQAITDPNRIRVVLGETLDRTLGELRQLGFLASQSE